ncbi:uncharacterized protein LOC134707510 [Mytilus trossulus]|uniref:uncharacterized protein LOC134707510 n=1 Tax=Mytilus trossulus TaxID=6551 RepID=UPI003004B46E
MLWFILLSWLLFLKTESTLIQEDLPQAMIECLKTFDDRITTQQAAVHKFCWDFFNWENNSNYTNSIRPKIYEYVIRLLSPFFTMKPLGISKSIRKEYRRLTDREREDFHKAVRMLKQDTSVPPNKYDALADLHTFAVSPSAHRGPSFPGWHRIFLVLFEMAIKEMVPGVILPYWDSTLDSNMMIPEQSVMFSEHFAGNNMGYVTTGPYRDFIGPNTGPLHRNISGSGAAISTQYAANILSQTRTKDITYPTADDANCLEEAHNDVHDWIGGQMGEIDTSADDPLFYVHHAFIDYLWSLFRMSQKEKGINPEFDYPRTAYGEHHPLIDMKPFGYFRNIHGYSDYWTDHVYSYEYSPFCTPDQPTCKSKWLKCDTKNWRCISQHIPFQSDIEKAIPHDFVIDGEQKLDLWCFVTVQVFYGTFADHLHPSYKEPDILDFGHLNQKQLTHHECQQKDQNTIDIYVGSNGVSYSGQYLDFVVMDKNNPFATSRLNIAISNKDNSSSHISAHDSCGRLCSPVCLVVGSKPPEYKPCTGMLLHRNSSSDYCKTVTLDDTVVSYKSIPFIKFNCDKFGALFNEQNTKE